MSQDIKTNSEQKQPIARADGPIICPGHSRPVPDIAFSKVTVDGYFLVSGCLDGKAMVREGSTGDWIGSFIGHKGAVWSTRLNNDASLALTASADYTAKLWCAVTGECKHSFTHKHLIVKSCAFSEEGNHFFTGSADKKIRLFDLQKPDAEPMIMEGSGGTIRYILPTPDPNIIVTSATDKPGVSVWDIRTLQVVRTLDTEEKELSCVSLSPDGSVISASSGNTVRMFNSTTFEQIKQHELPIAIDSVAYHPAVGRFVTGSDSELWVRAYDFDTGEEIACNKGHHGPVRSVAFNPSGTNYASGSEDGTIRIWELAPVAQTAANDTPA